MLKTQIILAAALMWSATSPGADLRIGIIGTDTSHVRVFTETFNNTNDTGYIAGGKVVAAVKAGSPDVKDSAARVDMYARDLKEKFGVKFYDSIEEMCSNVDAVLLESVDGRAHLGQFKSILRSGRKMPVFIDKPIAASLEEAQEIFRLAKEAEIPVFSSSSIRFGRTSQDVARGSIGKVLFAETYAPVHIEPHHPELYFYGVHGVEAICTVLGPGCQSVQRSLNPEGKIVVVGNWSGGRTGIFREEANDRYYFGVARGENGVAVIGTEDSYKPLLVQIMKFFKSGVAPVQPEETLQIMAFMTAADESKQQDGATVKLKELMPR